MRKIAALALVGAIMPLAGSARAQNMYLGLSVTTPGETYSDFPSAQHVKNNNNPLGMKLDGGIDLGHGYALEVGYGSFGTWTTADPAPGSAKEVRSSATLSYVAGKDAFAVSDALSLFGKLGIAANRFKFSDERQAVHTSFVRPMFGAGIDYAVTKHIRLNLEYDYYGADGRYRQQKLELGATFGF
jgi:opacity protein-like surface antigen